MAPREEPWSRMKLCEERGRSGRGSGSLVNHFIFTAAGSRSENTIKLKSLENHICLWIYLYSLPVYIHIIYINIYIGSPGLRLKPVEPNKAHWRKSRRRDFYSFKAKQRNQLKLAQGFNDPSSAGCSPALVHAGHLGRGLPAGTSPSPSPSWGAGHGARPCPPQGRVIFGG